MYLCAFNRDRDQYQIPKALAEKGLLGGLVTDYYHRALPFTIPALKHRQADEIPASLVTVSRAALSIQAFWEASQRVISWPLPERRVDRNVAKKAAKVARDHPDLDLLLYSDFAHEAFRLGDRRNVLFQFHPHPEFIRRVMADDAGRFGSRGHYALAELRDYGYQMSIHETETSLADLVLCASSTTARSVREAGVAADRVKIIPYGCPEPGASIEKTDPESQFRFLFVGSGGPRKGLHHLLSAWQMAKLDGATLELVMATSTPDIGPELLNQPGVRVHSKLSRLALESLMRESHVLVLPSLVEGFGLVLGEALAHGCHLLASTNTGLPDMKLPSSLATITDSVEPEVLVVNLVKARDSVVQAGRGLAVSAQEAARARSWEVFRSEIREALA